MKLSHKLGLIIAIPLLAYIVRTSRSVMLTLDDLNLAKVMHANMETFQSASNLIHELQKERGRTLLFLGGGSGYEDVTKQQEQSQSKIGPFFDALAKTQLSADATKTARESLNNLANLRLEAKASSAPAEVRGKYTALIKSILAVQVAAANAPTTKGIGKSMVYLTTIENTKEYAGQLRAMMSNILANNKPLATEQRNNLFSVEATFEVNLNQIVAANRSSREQVEALIKSQDFQDVNKIFWTIIEHSSEGNFGSESKVFFQKITNVIDSLAQLVSAEVSNIAKTVNSVESDATKEAWTAIAISLLVTVLVIIISVYVSRDITKSIQNIMANLLAASKQLTSAAHEVATTSQSLAQGATEQSASIEETSAAFEEISSMISQNADHSVSAKTLASSALTYAQEGVESMQKLLLAMNEIKATSDKTAEIVKSIDEIAFQTNLLALNAAVEAARAGDAGKGFAVVAEEVRNLAHRSSEAAKSTSQMINESVNKTAAGVSIRKTVEESLEKIGEGTKKVSDIIGEISSASSEQSKGMGELEKSVSEMDKVTQQNAASAEESAAASEELNAQAQELNSIVDRLRQLVEGK